MKKVIIVVCLVCILLFGVIVYNISKNDNENEIYKDNEYLDILDGKKVIKVSSVTDKMYKEDFATLVYYSDAVVKGKVSSVSYVAIEGLAWTKLGFLVEEVFKGDIKVSEEIDVYYRGGYITLDEQFNSIT